MKCKYIPLLQDEVNEANSVTSEVCNLRLEVRMNKVGTEDWFNYDEKVNFYTGLPNSYALMTVFELCHLRCNIAVYQLSPSFKSSQ